MIYRIYGHKSPSNKWYIGRTEQRPERRWRSGKSYKGQTKFYNAIQKYGWYAFDHIIIAETDTIESALIIEEMFKRWYDSVENGYNCVYSENEAPSKDPNVAKKISESRKGQHNSINTQFKTGIRNNPDGEFRPGTTWKLINGKRVWSKKEIV